MKVQPCPSCGARYNVERLTDGSSFECRRCGHAVLVGAHEPAPNPFSAGLLVAGLCMAVGLLLYANPRSGFGESQWPWELVRGEAELSAKATIVLWALAGVWALVTSLGIAPRSRSVLTLGLAGVLLLTCTWSQLAELRVDTPLHALLGMVSLGAGLLLLRDPQTQALARVLAFAGGLLLTWWFAVAFRETTPYLVTMVRDVRGLFEGKLTSHEATHQLLPDWALLLGGVTGLVVGLGAERRGLAWTGLALLLVALLLPALADLLDRMGEDDPWGDAGGIVAEYGTAALVSSGLALWLLAAQAVADLARNRKDT